MTTPLLLGQFAVSSASKDFAIGADACTIATGNYYTSGYTSESTDQLCEAVQAKIVAIGAAQSDSTVVHSHTTNRVTITLETAATLTWTDTALGVMLGYSAASYDSGTSFVAENPPRYTWCPARGMSEYPLYGTKAAYLLAPRSTTIVGRSNDGTSYSVPGNLLYDASIGFFCLDEEDVLTPTSGTVYRDLQQFWADVAHAGKPFRLYPDNSLNTSTDYVTCIWGREKDENLGAWTQFASRHTDTFNGLWNVTIPLLKKV